MVLLLEPTSFLFVDKHHPSCTCPTSYPVGRYYLHARLLEPFGPCPLLQCGLGHAPESRMPSLASPLARSWFSHHRARASWTLCAVWVLPTLAPFVLLVGTGEALKDTRNAWHAFFVSYRAITCVVLTARCGCATYLCITTLGRAVRPALTFSESIRGFSVIDHGIISPLITGFTYEQLATSPSLWPRRQRASRCTLTDSQHPAHV